MMTSMVSNLAGTVMHTDLVGNKQLHLDLSPTQQEVNHAWYWKPSILLKTSEVTDLGKNLPPPPLNQWNP